MDLHLYASLSSLHSPCSQLWPWNPNIPAEEAGTKCVPGGHQQRGKWGLRDCPVKLYLHGGS